MRPLTPVDVEEQICRCLKDLEQATEEYEKHAKEAAQAEVTYKVEYAKALLRAEEKTVGDREARATIDCESFFYERKGAEAVLAAQKELLSTLRARLDALRSLSASVRVQT